MRRLIGFLAVFGLCLARPADAGDPDTPRRIALYFTGWYEWYTLSRVVAEESRDVAVPGFEAYRVSRQSDSRMHQESNVALYDRSRDEIFVGDVFDDPRRRAARHPFDAAADLPNVEAALTDALGLPVEARREGAARGALLPIVVRIREAEGAVARRDGFVSADGATLLLGEFRPLAETPAAFRAGLLAENRGVRPRSGSFTLAEFLDFQCDRCRVRTPMAEKLVSARGGALEFYFLPLVKGHDWSFAAAEAAAALASVSPELFARYMEALFSREGMTAEAARQLAADVAEAAGRRADFGAELSSGRARQRVARDITLAIRLGIGATPRFVHAGTLVAGERGVLEAYLERAAFAPRGAAPR